MFVTNISLLKIRNHLICSLNSFVSSLYLLIIVPELLFNLNSFGPP